MSKPRVYIIHGWEGTPESNWFPWLKRELESVDAAEVYTPALPHTEHPLLGEWLEALSQEINRANESVFLVGHSLGVITILRYLESISAEARVGGVVSVAGFAESVGIEATASFFETPVNFKKVKGACDAFVVIDSDDDPYVPMARGDTLEHELSAKRITLPSWKHFNTGAGITEVPIVLKELLEMVRTP